MADIPHETCPDEDAVLAFARGELDEAPLAAVEAHLDVCRACAVAVGAATDRDLRGAALEARPLTPSSLGPGALVAGRYRVVRLLGRGGMGEVYEVVDGGGARLALKTVAAVRSDDPKAIARLRREAELGRRIIHRNVCRIYEVADWEHGLLMTMELIEGETLGALRRSQPHARLTEATVAAMLPDLAAGLTAAHVAGVIHRDLKTDNIMVCSPDGEGAPPRLVVMDFGLARPLVSDERSPTLTTDERQIVGSAAYLAPEQIKPAGALGPACDIYALGVVLFELLTGTMPFQGGTPLETALLRLTQPAPLPRALVPDLDPRWEPIIARCLEREASERFRTAAEIPHAWTHPARKRGSFFSRRGRR